MKEKIKQEGKKKEPGVQFAPITEGLGFHPFSGGLPYAPVSKSTRTDSPAQAPQYRPTPPSAPQSMGTGAVAAGRPKFGRISVPIAAPVNRSTTQKTIPVQQPQVGPSLSQRPAPLANRFQTEPTPSRALPLAPKVEEEFGFGYILRRFFSYILDTCLNFGLALGAFSVALWNQGLSPDTLLSPGVAFLSIAFLCSFNWAIITAQEVAFGTSFGKRIFGLALRGSASAIFLRAFFFLPSIGFCGVGILWALFDHKRRCWHDLVVDLQPTYLTRL